VSFPRTRGIQGDRRARAEVWIPVIHHTNCGMELFSDEVMANLREDNLATASFDGKAWSNPHHDGGRAAGHFIKWHTIKNQEASVVQDVRRIREHPLVPADVPIYGYIYDVKTGRLEEVKAATESGKPPRPEGGRERSAGLGRHISSG
jgi:carbonic anhydrase